VRCSGSPDPRRQRTAHQRRSSPFAPLFWRG
jgi:hypothetical protein